MSHYISANLGGKELEFCIGLNWRSISALRQSGWCVYENYENYSELEEISLELQEPLEWASTFNRGVSGSGEASKIDNEVATHAYKNALLWALAFKETYPDLYFEEYDRAVEIFRDTEEEFDLFLRGIALEDSEIDKELQDLITYQEFLTEDEKERAFGNLWRVIYFSYKIYEFTSTGEKAEVYFS